MINKCQPNESNLIGTSLNTQLKPHIRREAILKICDLEKAHTLAIKEHSAEINNAEQSLGIDDEKIMDLKPPNPDLRAGAGYHPGAEDSGHGT